MKRRELLVDSWEDAIPEDEVDRIIDLAIQEDSPGGDITSEAIFKADHFSDASVFVREDSVVAGLPLFIRVYRKLSDAVEISVLFEEGEEVGSGEEIVRMRGPTAVLLRGERVALNFIQRLSGIATLTRRLVRIADKHGVTLLDTRKTTPGLRVLEKYAVRVGGGENHRLSLSDMYLIKENHIAAAGGIVKALERMEKGQQGEMEVEVEVKNLEELKRLLSHPVDRVMLDNFSPEEVGRAVEMIQHGNRDGSQPSIEVSGGIGETNIEAYCLEGVDYISVGLLTHSVKSIDMTLILQGGGR